MLRLGQACYIGKRKGIQILFDKGPPTSADTGTADEAPVTEKLAVCDEMQQRELNLRSRMFAAGVAVDALVVAKRFLPAKERLRGRAVFTGCLGNQQQWRLVDFLSARSIRSAFPVYFLEGFQSSKFGQGIIDGHLETR